MILMFIAVVGIYGLFVIYAAVKSRKSGKLHSLFRTDKHTVIRDERGYIDFIYGRSVFMGVMAILMGIVLGINEYAVKIPQIVNCVLLLFITVCVWNGASMNKGKQKFW